MNESTPYSIITLPFTREEINSHTRHKSRYHTFVAFYLKEFKECSYEDKKQKLVSSGIHRIQLYTRHENTPRIYDAPVASAAQRLRLASLHWSRMRTDLKEAWKERANMANQLPLLGIFAAVPASITNQHILVSINHEIDKFVKIMQRSLKKAGNAGPDIRDSVLFKSFNNEKQIQVRTKIFRSICVNHLLKIIYFGDDYSYLRPSEIVHRTKKVCIIYIHSKERMVDLFDKNEKCAFEVRDGENIYGCGGRSILRSVDRGLERIGYVMDEEGDDIYIQLEGDVNKKIKMAKPSLDSKFGRWIFEDSDEYEWVEYEPVRIKVIEKGNMHFLFHHIAYDEENNLIEY